MDFGGMWGTHVDTSVSQVKTFLGNFHKPRQPVFYQNFINFPNKMIRYNFCKISGPLSTKVQTITDVECL